MHTFQQAKKTMLFRTFKHRPVLIIMRKDQDDGPPPLINALEDFLEQPPPAAGALPGHDGAATATLLTLT